MNDDIKKKAGEFFWWAYDHSDDLFHGSSHRIEGNLKPQISFHSLPYIYATSDTLYALVRAGFFDNNTMIREDYTGGHYELTELEPGAFERAFNRGGFIYAIAPEGFNLLRGGMPNEYVANEEQPISDTFFIPNVWDMIKYYEQQSPNYFSLITFDQADDAYWSHVTGGREGYMARRKAAREKLAAKLAEAETSKN